MNAKTTTRGLAVLSVLALTTAAGAWSVSAKPDAVAAGAGRHGCAAAIGRNALEL